MECEANTRTHLAANDVCQEDIGAEYVFGMLSARVAISAAESSAGRSSELECNGATEW